MVENGFIIGAFLEIDRQAKQGEYIEVYGIFEMQAIVYKGINRFYFRTSNFTKD